MFSESLNAITQIVPAIVILFLSTFAYVIVRGMRHSAQCWCVITAHANARSEEDGILAQQVHRMAELAERFGWGVKFPTQKYFRFTNHKFWFIPASDYLQDSNAREYDRVSAIVSGTELPVVVLMTCAKDRRMNDDGTPKSGRVARL